jgi:phosphoribosyl 1,2-cyclic phosphodiesterase
VKVTFWGTRGSIATPGRETNRYGGDTSCVAVTGTAPDHLLVLDAGTGIRRLGLAIPEVITRIDVFLTHLHLDHIVGLGFFAPLFRPNVSMTIWGPRATTSLLDRLGRYLSPPLFPVRLRDVVATLELEEVPAGRFELGDFAVTAEPVIHPDPALGYRIESNDQVLAYLPDHEPALGPSFPGEFAWTSGAALAHGAQLLIHDAQYEPAEYADRIGWGHSSVTDAVAFADLVDARTLALFHHDPARNDAAVEALLDEAKRASKGVAVLAAREGTSIDLDHPG